MPDSVSFNFSSQIISEDAVLISFAHLQITQEAKNQLVTSFYVGLNKADPAWLIDVVPSYETLLVYFDYVLTDAFSVQHFLRRLKIQTSEHTGKKHRFPVYYGAPANSFPVDLERLSEKLGMPQNQIIATHSEKSYRIFALGFLPNFAYSGELNKRIQCARLASPRKKVPAGAVAIADNQTAIYPQQSSGGWHIVGYCPLNLADYAEFKVGDELEFFSVDLSQYHCLVSKRLKDGDAAN